jgi:hypothetical protein
VLHPGGDAGRRAKCCFAFHVFLRPPIWPERTPGFKIRVTAAASPAIMVNELFHAQLAAIIE